MIDVRKVMRRRAAVAALVMSLLGFDTARAGDLFTPPLLVPDIATQRLLCIAVNVGTTPKPIHVELIRSDGGTIAAMKDCPEVPPQRECFVTTDASISDGHCRFSSKAKLRAALWVQKKSDSTVVLSLPATK